LFVYDSLGSLCLFLLCGGNSLAGGDIDHPPHLVPRFRSTAVPVYPPLAYMTCYTMNFTMHLCEELIQVNTFHKGIMQLH
jgi:hypothetical protein